jgi:hypothetical protein
MDLYPSSKRLGAGAKLITFRTRPQAPVEYYIQTKPQDAGSHLPLDRFRWMAQSIEFGPTPSVWKKLRDPFVRSQTQSRVLALKSPCDRGLA